MQIKSIRVDNFKSLVNFELPLAKFSCLVGLNGSDKSTVLQLFDFLSQQFRGDLSGWLNKRQWEPSDLNSKLTRKQNISFEILLSHVDPDFLDEPVEIKWSASFNRQSLRCTAERLEWNELLLLKVEDGYYQISTLYTHKKEVHDLEEGELWTEYYQFRVDVVLSGEIAFNYQGSLLSQIKESQLPKELCELKKFFIDLHALDMLAPELLRQRTRDAGNSLGLGGEKLSAFLHEIGESKRVKIQSKLAKIYPQLKHIDTSSLRSGWKSLTV